MTEVPKRGGTSGTADRATLWKSYQGIGRIELFGPPTQDPNDPAYQFHLRYLDVLEDMEKHHNTFVVPFWNAVAHPAWVAAPPTLEKAASAIGVPSVQAAFSAVQAAFRSIKKPVGFQNLVLACFKGEIAEIGA